jgi:CheY-like chemotaxis protein/HPt (histidine-containing phosphotransfer) domain-containing protein
LIEPFDCRLNVLCAEDGHTNRVIVQAFVQGLGHDVSFVENGLLAVQRCAEENFDLILMDGRMPVMDGLAAARAIREGGIDGAWVLDPEIWMIALTANATGNDRELSLAAGMNDFLPKPVDERALAQSLHRAIDALRARGRTLRPAQTTVSIDSSLAALDAMLGDGDIDADSDGGAIVEGGPDASFAADDDPALHGHGAVVAERPPAPATATAAATVPPIRSLAERLREAFRAETPRMLVDLGQALAVRDFAHAARIAHNIKGSAYYIQCEPMADHAAALERACDDGDAVSADTHWINLQDCIEAWTTHN